MQADTDYSNNISIHALHEESDKVFWRYTQNVWQFQSTLSMRRATGISDVSAHVVNISIHALHEESDRFRPEAVKRWLHFNPRSP